MSGLTLGEDLLWVLGGATFLILFISSLIKDELNSKVDKETFDKMQEGMSKNIQVIRQEVAASQESREKILIMLGEIKGKLGMSDGKDN